MSTVSKHDPFFQNDAFLAAIVNSSHDAIFAKDLNGTIVTWNTAAERIFGYSASEAIGRPVTLLFPEDRYNEEPEILRRIQSGQVVDHYETVRRRKDGSLVEVALTVSPIRGPDGAVIGASKIARDITASKLASERTSITLSSIGDGVISTDAEGRVLFLNAVAESLTGWPLDEAIGMPCEKIFSIVNEFTRLPVLSPLEKALKEGKVAELVNHTLLISRDGLERPVDDSAAPVRNGAGLVVGGVLIFRDVSRRRAAEIASSMLAAIVQGSDDAIVGKNLRGIVTSWNAGAEKVFGYTEEEMVGQPITLLIPPERIHEETEIIARLQRGERVDHFQTIRRRKDGKLIQVSVTISPVHNEHGEIIGASKIARDTSFVREAQEKLEQYTLDLESRVKERTALLQHSLSELEAFSYSLSHDMRAPLRAIQSYTEIVLSEEGATLGTESREHLDRVVRAASRMDRLIRDVLSFARISQSELQISAVNIDRLVRELVAEKVGLSGASITIEGVLFAVLGHEASLAQCVSNLLDNAIKFVTPGATPLIRIFTEREKGRIRFCVRDNGIGIEPSQQARVFGMFERLSGNELHYDGTGVGLAIVRKAVNRMNGEVGVDSLLGKGSTFWIKLPAA